MHVIFYINFALTFIFITSSNPVINRVHDKNLFELSNEYLTVQFDLSSGRIISFNYKSQLITINNEASVMSIDNLPLNSEDDIEKQQSSSVLKEQKYSTWLYIFLLIVCIYLIFSIGITKVQVRTRMVSEINSSRFRKLYQDVDQSLSCPCSKTTIPLGDFVNNNVIFHPLCSSIFISKQWIEALYSPMANRYPLDDFRKTASHLFSILADFCFLAKNTIASNLIYIDRYEVATIHLHTEKQIQSEVNAIIEYYKNSSTVQIYTFLNYLGTVNRAHYLVSALNTNGFLEIVKREYEYNAILQETYITKPALLYGSREVYCKDADVNKHAALTLANTANDPYVKNHKTWKDVQKNDEVTGFRTSCTVLKAAYASRLNCLYDMDCLKFLFEYFPTLNHTSSNWSNCVLSSNKALVTVKNLLSNLFILNWSIKTNYLEYFNKCSPLHCTYTKTDQMNPSYVITLFISLYGGLIIILRLITTFLVKVVLEFRNRLAHKKIHLGKFLLDDKIVEV
ncbi:hypothetical protein I4U23_011260 [Adineta vaga]|nr:hypothetical protein I4U23_011260 [Adineta vaga]